jgi:hypothetical protein
MSSTPSPNSQPEKITVESIVPAPIEETPYSGVYLALEIKQAELDHQKLLNNELQENIERRGNWGERVFWLLVGWLLSVVGVVLCQGFVYKGFHLDNSVIIAFIATTTVDVLSLGYIVANYLFQKNK